MSDKAAGQKTRSPKGCDQNGPAAALLLSHVSIQICSFVAPCRRPILIATPLPQSLTLCTSIGKERNAVLSKTTVRSLIPKTLHRPRRDTSLTPSALSIIEYTFRGSPPPRHEFLCCWSDAQAAVSSSDGYSLLPQVTLFVYGAAGEGCTLQVGASHDNDSKPREIRYDRPWSISNRMLARFWPPTKG
jgi:hypothetical protein